MIWFTIANIIFFVFSARLVGINYNLKCQLRNRDELVEAMRSEWRGFSGMSDRELEVSRFLIKNYIGRGESARSK